MITHLYFAAAHLLPLPHSGGIPLSILLVIGDNLLPAGHPGMGIIIKNLEVLIMVFEAIAELIAERNDCDPSEVTMETSFQDLGIDSLDTVEMLMNLEDKLGKEIELDQRVETVGDLVRYIEAKM